MIVLGIDNRSEFCVCGERSKKKKKKKKRTIGAKAVDVDVMPGCRCSMKGLKARKNRDAIKMTKDFVSIYYKRNHGGIQMKRKAYHSIEGF